MLTCPRCRAGVSTGATDCAVCGLVLARQRPSTQAWSKLPDSVRALSCGAFLAAWLPLATVYTVWFFPIGVLLSFIAGWVVARISRPQTRRSAALFLPLPILAYIWFFSLASSDKTFGQMAMYLALVHAAAAASGLSLRLSLAK